MLGVFLRYLFSGLMRLLFGSYPRWLGSEPQPKQRIYFANHTSHLDTMVIWSSLPPDIRKMTRPVAARDYWERPGIRGVIARQVLNVVFISRKGESENPLEPLMEALEKGYSLIIFPEGKRNFDLLPKDFKAGIFHLAESFPNVDIVPCYIENTRRAWPKGTYITIPFTCCVNYGAPLTRIEGESKADFLARARKEVIKLMPFNIV